jgi:hypothetical protein
MYPNFNPDKAAQFLPHPVTLLILQIAPQFLDGHVCDGRSVSDSAKTVFLRTASSVPVPASCFVSLQWKQVGCFGPGRRII